MPYETRCETGRTSAEVRATKSHRNFLHAPDPPPLDPKLKFWCVLFYLGALSRLVALRNSVQNRPNKCKSSCHVVVSEFFATNTPNPSPVDPKLMFWCVLFYLGALRTVWLHYETRCKRAELVQKFVHEVASEFFATNAPDPPHWTLN